MFFSFHFTPLSVENKDQGVIGNLIRSAIRSSHGITIRLHNDYRLKRQEDTLIGRSYAPSKQDDASFGEMVLSAKYPVAVRQMWVKCDVGRGKNWVTKGRMREIWERIAIDFRTGKFLSDSSYAVSRKTVCKWWSYCCLPFAFALRATDTSLPYHFLPFSLLLNRLSVSHLSFTLVSCFAFTNPASEDVGKEID